MSVKSFTVSVGILLLLVMGTGVLNAQVRTKRFGQSQNLESYGLSGAKQQLVPTLSLPAVDPAPLLAQDEVEAKNGMPFRFGLNRDVSINLIKVAAKGQQNGFQTYAYRIDAAGAFSLNLIFDRFRLKEGSKLFLYNGDRTMIVGPITEAQNPVSGELWTDLVQGSNLTIELQEPLSGAGVSELNLRSVVHGYKNTFPDKLFGQSGACHPNIMCYPAFQPEGDGVAMILLASGSRLCTGFMVNTMRQSFRSFFQSAFHCVDLNNNNVADAGEITNVENWLVRFNYQSPTCTPSQEDTDVITLNGTTYRAGYADSDVALVELTQQVPFEVNTTYNGWNRGAATTSNNFSIHHPRGDVKKISFTNADTQVSGYRAGASGTSHLISFWGSLGVTDPGSSGSPLFDGNRRIVGQLHGGPSFCGATGTGLRDYYGRVFTSWTGGGTNNSRLSNWLDPDNSSGTTTDGVKPLLSGPAAVSATEVFSLNTLRSSIVSWSVTGGVGLVSPTSGAGNSASLTPIGNASSLTITFSVSDGQNYPIRFSTEFSTSAPVSPTTGGALSLLRPTYNCATGAITFNTAGGDGTTITYSAIGVQRSSPTGNTGTVEAGLRADPKPLVITATQSGTTVSQTFDFGIFCSNPPSSTTGSPPSTTAGSLSLIAPTYNCATGTIVFNTAAGDGATITYTAVGVQRASATSNTGTVESGLRADPKPLVITATQSGITVSQTFDFGAFCSSPPSSTTTPGGSLSPLMPTYACATGAITFNTAGGDGTAIVYTAVGVQRASATSNTGVVEAGLRADPKPLVITATQSGVTVSQTFDFAAFCAQTRLASEGPEAGLRLRVLGNPTNSASVWVEIRGAIGQSLTMRVLDINGLQQSEQHIDKPRIVEIVSLPLGHSAGIYVVEIQSAGQRRTERISKAE